MIDDENYLGADGRHIFICQKNTLAVHSFDIFIHLSLSLSLSEATVEADLLYMLQPSRMYFGDNINVFSRGTCVGVL